MSGAGLGLLMLVVLVGSMASIMFALLPHMINPTYGTTHYVPTGGTKASLYIFLSISSFVVSALLVVAIVLKFDDGTIQELRGYEQSDLQ